ncbi:MAG: hypothetical protein IPL64_00675 [Flavobacteriales bacterium]|jgi:hypothetical protein|nr:hypothetical protein [Flavobacteriales bacterium]MBK8530390.1 hypothetical protein [Flavobacteriales bacterium]MBK8707294.1 hypothetical protein [Flavobacteriales bacterium]
MRSNKIERPASIAAHQTKSTMWMDLETIGLSLILSLMICGHTLLQ